VGSYATHNLHQIALKKAVKPEGAKTVGEKVLVALLVGIQRRLNGWRQPIDAQYDPQSPIYPPHIVWCGQPFKRRARWTDVKKP